MAGTDGSGARPGKAFKYTPIFRNSFVRPGGGPAAEEAPGRCRSAAARAAGLALLAALLALSLAGTALLWGTDVFRTAVIENLALRNGSQSLLWWQHPPVRPRVSFYLFNYTNAEQFLRGREPRLRVQELGPYTYWETLQRVDLRWQPAAGSLSFRERRSYEFAPELSAGAEGDLLTAPNVPMIAAVAAVQHEHYLVRLSLAAVLSSLHARPFVSVTARDLLWGYDDQLFTMGRTVMAMRYAVPITRFGLMAQKNGTSAWRVAVDTGERDLARLGLITEYAGRDHVDYYRSAECNRVDGSEGTLFPPQLVRRRAPLHLYSRDLCRRFPLEFHRHSQAFSGIPTLRYRPPRDVFAHPAANPDNQCFCDPAQGRCPPSGLFNVSSCAFGSPVLLSFPHFYLGDPALLASVDGLRPDPQRHDTFMDIHPELGVPLAASASMQVNMQVRKAGSVSQLDPLEDGDILPVIWIQKSVLDLPAEVRSVLFHATFSARALQLGLLYGLPLLAAASAAALLRACRRARRPPPLPPATAAAIALAPDHILTGP